MHETMVANSLLKAISATAAEQNAKPVSAKISCGQLYTVNDEVLTFAFAAIAKGTICEGLELKIEHKPLQAKCNKCSQSFDIDDIYSVDCPHCQSKDIEPMVDAPLMLEEVELQTE